MPAGLRHTTNPRYAATLRTDAASIRPAPTAPSAPPARASAGLFYGLGAHVFWGVVAVLYFHQLREISPVELVGHRVVWSFLFVLILLACTRRLGAARRALRDRKLLARLALSATLVSVNWLVFILAVSGGQIMQASLGYFLNPLANVALGVVALRERLRPAQSFAVLLAAGAVANLVLAGGTFPWMALTLAVSFALYGLVRKLTPVDTVVALGIECAVLLPAGAIVIAWSLLDPASSVASAPPYAVALVVLAGAVTAIPLMLFGAAARRLSLTTLGFVQYIGPSCQLMMAVLVFDEPLDRARLITFGLIWLALAVFSVDSIAARRRAKRQAGTGAVSVPSS
jgi:chloramphenicol-sensitive protein RarD